MYEDGGRDVFEDKEKKEYDKNARKECRGGKGGKGGQCISPSYEKRKKKRRIMRHAPTCTIVVGLMINYKNMGLLSCTLVYRVSRRDVIRLSVYRKVIP
jgi:hypothetical protein